MRGRGHGLGGDGEAVGVEGDVGDGVCAGVVCGCGAGETADGVGERDGGVGDDRAGGIGDRAGDGPGISCGLGTCRCGRGTAL